MKSFVKKLLAAVLKFLIRILVRSRIGLYFLDQFSSGLMNRSRQVTYSGVTMNFATPNALCDWRASTFASKEPETLEWIDNIPEGAVLWDIGSNIGLYSVYAAKKRKCRVYSFEPSVFNLELLARNIFLNDLTGQICILPFALSDRLGCSEMRMTTTQWGGALSTFGKDFGWDGKTIERVFQFETIGLSMDDAMLRLAIPQPDFIKMDVDGLEHFILKGGPRVLAEIKSILIEVNDHFVEQAEGVKNTLTEANLVFKEKKHSEIIANSTEGLQNSYNQIWIRT
ncbi:MAG: FkbM family methyltransferase [Bacteroidetes bacterium]|nr:FkbM family methyltransferase [Bacteroidota bacterium]